MTKGKKLLEPVSGSYTPVPHAVLDSVAFLGASNRAKAMLFELLRQHNGRNNGHLQLAVAWLKVATGGRRIRSRRPRSNCSTAA